MCGRYKLSDVEAAGLLVGALLTVNPRYNIAPSQNVLTSRAVGTAEQMKWGFVPPWGGLQINAQSETVRTKGLFKQAFATTRCIVLADGFYEWKKIGKGKAMIKYPHLFKVNGGEPFAFAGFWLEQLDKGEKKTCCCILTTAPNAVLAPIHDRMPVIINKQDWGEWLEPKEVKDSFFKHVTAPYDAKVMSDTEVSAIVNNARNDVPECALPVPPMPTRPAPPTQPDLFNSL